MKSFKFQIIILGLILFSISVHSQNVKQFFISPSGNDKYAGTIEKPFATLEKARKAVRKILAKEKNISIAVYFRAGDYFLKNSVVFDSLDSGTGDNPVTYSAYNNEVVSFSGGISIPVKYATPVKDDLVLNRFPLTAKNKILRIDLKRSGIKDFGTLTPRGFARPYQPAPMELFCNKAAMHLARYPNDTLIPLGKVLDPGSIPRNGDFSHRGGKFQFSIDEPDRWAAAKDIWISGFFRYGYADDAVQIADLDLKNRIISTRQETLYGFESGKNFQRWFAYNLLEEIDSPGEYYIDRTSGILYFYGPEEELKTIEVSMLEEPLVQLKNTSFIHFNGINFECSRGIGVYIEKGNDNKIDNCVFRNLGIVGVCVGKGIEPFAELTHEGDGQPASGKLGSLMNYMYKHTTFDREAGTGHIISNCEIYNTGSGGISLGGGVRLTLKKGNNQVANCSIHDFNRLDRSYKAGINIDGVGNVIRNCEIFNCPGSAILLHGNDHLIEYNSIHHAVTDGDDMGAIYYGRDPSEFGNKVQYNFFHHIGNDHGLIVSVYHDDGACGMEVTGNIFYLAGKRSVLIGGGSDNAYRNNIFIESPMAFHLDNRLMGWAKANVDKDGIFQKRLEAVNYKQAPYATAYPKLKNYFEDSPALPKRNFIENNVFVNIKLIHNGNADWSYFGKNYIASGDPGFENYNEMNFQLKPSSEIFKLLPGFKAIPFHKIGIQEKNRTLQP
ncbi:MAG TPA: right-handed parallel beta-helix repeat-containing protein [Chitinophagaceae bacterium]|nr:right-handed parallel beta-helix repeat-containing protein [Chitinophagaceae bacterium]